MLQFGWASMSPNWIEVFFRDLNLYSVAWYEPRNWPWWHFIMDQTLALNWTIGEPTWGPKSIEPSKGSMVVTYKNWMRTTPPRYMQVSRDRIEGLQIELTMMAFHNEPNAHSRSNHRWTHVRSESQLRPTRASWSWHTKIGCGQHPQHTCKYQGTKLRVYT